MNLGSPYFLLLAIGFAIGCWWFVRRGEKLGVARVALIDVCIFAIIGGLAGGRLLHVLVEPLPDHTLGAHEREELRTRLDGLDPEGQASLQRYVHGDQVDAVWLFIARMPAVDARAEAIAIAAERPGEVPARLWYRARPIEVLMFWKGGLAYIGGLGLAILLCLISTYRHKASIRDAIDAASPAIILGLIFGRIGCFLGGCCYGDVCEAGWWSTPPPWYELPAGQLSRYPTALFSAAFALALFLTLRWLLNHRAFAGEVFLALLVLYAPGRFAIEELRDDPRGGVLGLSTTQVAVLVSGVPALIAWIALRVRARRRPKSEEISEPELPPEPEPSA